MRKKKSLPDRIAEKIDAATARVERLNQKLEKRITRMEQEGADQELIAWYKKRFQK